MCRVNEEGAGMRMERFLRIAVVLVIVVLGGLAMRDWIRSAERVRVLEQENVEMASMLTSQDNDLTICRAGLWSNREVMAVKAQERAGVGAGFKPAPTKANR